MPHSLSWSHQRLPGEYGEPSARGTIMGMDNLAL